MRAWTSPSITPAFASRSGTAEEIVSKVSSKASTGHAQVEFIGIVDNCLVKS
jgi:hypothetical protein